MLTKNLTGLKQVEPFTSDFVSYVVYFLSFNKDPVLSTISISKLYDTSKNYCGFEGNGCRKYSKQILSPAEGPLVASFTSLLCGNLVAVGPQLPDTWFPVGGKDISHVANTSTFTRQRAVFIASNFPCRDFQQSRVRHKQGMKTVHPHTPTG